MLCELKDGRKGIGVKNWGCLGRMDLMKVEVKFYMYLIGGLVEIDSISVGALVGYLGFL